MSYNLNHRNRLVAVSSYALSKFKQLSICTTSYHKLDQTHSAFVFKDFYLESNDLLGTEMAITIALTSTHLQTLDLGPVQQMIESWLEYKAIAQYEQQLRFAIEYLQDSDDQREFSEIPEVRLWFIRLDATYPWLPFLLDWQSGELVRYAAMLVPHQFNTREGIQYNPEALDIFIMQKVFVLTSWLPNQGLESESKLKAMAQMFGYELDSGLFNLIHTA